MAREWQPIARVYDPLKAGSIDGTDEIPHDKAIFRAMNAKYKPNKNVIGDPDNTVFVGRLSPNTDEEMLESHFMEYGMIKRLRLVRDIVTGFSRCYGFIEYVDNAGAFNAQRHADKTILDEMEIYVDFECERTLKGWVPRRLGGGICGKKESGQLRFGGKNRPFRKPYNINNVQQPDGKTFRDRLRATEDSNYSNQRDSSRYNKQKYDRNYGDRGRKRSRSRDKYTRGNYRRSRSRERSSYKRSQSRDRRSRSRDRSHRRH